MRRKANTLPDATSPAPGAVLAVHRSKRSVNPVFDPVSAVSLQVLWLRLLLPYPCATTLKCSPFKNSTTQKKKRRKNAPGTVGRNLDSADPDNQEGASASQRNRNRRVGMAAQSICNEVAAPSGGG